MNRDPMFTALPPATTAAFDYDTAFGRNLGWVTEWEQQLLRCKRIAIAGMGGVGGAHLLTLTRLGIGKFHIADMDVFDTVNFNRQVGAGMTSLGRAKVDVMAEMALDINPAAEITRFPGGVSDANIDAFLEGVDLFVDGFDFFVLDMRAKVFARCAELGIPAVTAAPIGMGAAYLLFMPGGMTFEQYFGLAGQPLEQQYVNFLVGLTPRGLHRAYLVDQSRVNLGEKRGPSTGMACQICAGITGVEVLRVLLGRGGVKAAPWFHQFDAFRGRLVSARIRGGARNPLQRLRQKVGFLATRAMAARSGVPDCAGPASRYSVLEQILDLARWAPSGDNSQPWRFRIEGEDRVAIVPIWEPDNVYDYRRGQPTRLALGCLLETLRIAASGFGRSMTWSLRPLAQPGALHPFEIEVHLPQQAGIAPDPLIGFIKVRSVNRSAMRRDRLSAQQKSALEEALGPKLKLRWFEHWQERLSIARLNRQATDIRLRSREAYDVHRRVINWASRFSTTGMPSTGLGLTPLTQKIMRWAMVDWSRIERLNRFAGGTLMAQFELDVLPGFACASHFTVGWHSPPASTSSTEELLDAGRHLQRFWLTATSLGLSLQPGLAPLIFATHAADAAPFSDSNDLVRKSCALAADLQVATGVAPGALVFMGRIGRPKSTLADSRSHRMGLDELMIQAPKGNQGN